MYTVIVPEMKLKLVEFVNSIEPDEMAHNEPPHLDLHCLLSCLDMRPDKSNFHLVC